MEQWEKVRRYRWMMFGVLSFGYVLVIFHRLCPAVLAVDMMADLEASGALMGLLGSAYFYPYAIMQLPAGILADSWGPRKTVTCFFAIAAVGSLGLGLAGSPDTAVVARVVVGLGVSMLFVPTIKILSQWFTGAEFAMMTAVLLAMGGVGSLSAAGPLAALSSWIGWRLSFVAVGGLTLFIALVVWYVVRDKPSDMGWPNVVEVGSEEKLGMAKVKQVLSNPSFWPLACWFFFTAGVFFAFGGLWGGPYMAHVAGLSKTEAGSVLSFQAVGMIVGSPLLGYISNRMVRSRKRMIVGGASVMICLMSILAFFPDRLGVVSLSTLCLLMGIFGTAIVAIGFTAAKELYPVDMAGTATGLINLFPFAGGAVLQPVLGWVIESAGREPDGAFTLIGYQQGFILLLAGTVIAFVSSLMVRETHPDRA